jgi:hypothetical protein
MLLHKSLHSRLSRISGNWRPRALTSFSSTNYYISGNWRPRALWAVSSSSYVVTCILLLLLVTGGLAHCGLLVLRRMRTLWLLHKSLHSILSIISGIVGLFCHIVGLFCLAASRMVGSWSTRNCCILGLFCHIVGLFCHIVGLFCLAASRIVGSWSTRNCCCSPITEPGRMIRRKPGVGSAFARCS